MKTERIYKIASFFMQDIEEDIFDILKSKKEIIDLSEIIVFDVGCYRGLFSKRIDDQLKRNKISNNKYFLFDPNHKVKNYLSETLEFDYSFHQIAISDSMGEEDFYYNPTLEFSMSSLDDRFLKSKLWRFSRSIFSLRRYESIKTFKVPTNTIDNFCNEKNIPSIDILKIDVEGTQLNVLKGAETMLENVSVIFIEILEEKKLFRQSLKEVVDLLAGYNFVLLKEKQIFTTRILSPYRASDCIFVKR